MKQFSEFSKSLLKEKLPNLSANGSFLSIKELVKDAGRFATFLYSPEHVKVNENNDYVTFIHNESFFYVNSMMENVLVANPGLFEVESVKVDAVHIFKSQDRETYSMEGAFVIKYQSSRFVFCNFICKSENNSDRFFSIFLVNKDDIDLYNQFKEVYEKEIINYNKKNKSITVIGIGELIFKDKDQSCWDDLFLEKNIKDDLKLTIEGFLKSSEFYKTNNIPWKRGVILHGPPGCGKSSIIKSVINEYPFKAITVASGATNEDMMDAFDEAEKHSPSLLFLEDLDSLLNSGVDLSEFLNLMDGISSKNGILIIATANDLKALKSSITDRPSRFDRKILIPLPDKTMSLLYLKKWFKDSISVDDVNSVVEKCVKNKLSYAHLKELYISSAYEMIAQNKDKFSIEDVNKSLNKILNEKKNVKKSTTIDMDNYITGE